VYDHDLADPDALLARYSTLTGWSEALASMEDKHDVSVVHRFGRDAKISRNGVEYIFCADGGPGAPAPWVWTRRLHRAVVDATPDLVHVNGLEFFFQTMLLRGRLPGTTAVVVQDHASGIPDITTAKPAQSVRRYLRRSAMRSPDAFFFTASSQADAWRSAGYIAAGQPVHQVLESSTVIQPVWRSQARKETGIDGDPALLWVGRLNANKDPLTVIAAFERVLATLPDATLTMVYGTDDLLAEIQQRLRGSEMLGSRVRLAGRVPHDRLAAFYSAADVFVLGSHHEGSGYALLESCACGLPAAVTNIPTFRVITGDGAIGALWEPGDPESCAAAVTALSRGDRPAIRERVLEHFERSLSWPAVARAAVTAYSEAWARRRVKSA